MLGVFDVHEDSQTLDLRMSPARFDPSEQACSDSPDSDSPSTDSGSKCFVMNASVRFLDGMNTIGREGTVIYWISYYHQVYSGSRRFEEYWKYLPIRNRFGASNIATFV